MSSPYFSPGRFCSARNKSPALKWIKPYCFTNKSHWVPLPDPGPPRTKITDTWSGEYSGCFSGSTAAWGGLFW